MTQAMTQVELLQQELKALSEEQRQTVYARIANLLAYVQDADPGDDEFLAGFIRREYVSTVRCAP